MTMTWEGTGHRAKARMPFVFRLAAWAKSILGVKDGLTLEDVQQVETAFEARLAQFPVDPVEQVPAEFSEPKRSDPSGEGIPNFLTTAAHSVIAQHTGAIPKTVRHRNKEHLRFVRTQPCLVCARQPADAHHLRFAQPHALGRKVSDEFTVPLCRAHHREVHRANQDTKWWLALKIAPLQAAEQLWQQSHSASGAVL